ncbi:hypothetical protein HHK36_026542 [Tetracentron sinense]|uniref:Uncharacterized protein n=1 Tax=Tetracentron sinense TaxID=13715 RepID=A0A834YH22_TETSI|nr:hypothetical protein HHK36_026542 [Tetracentron sinense]
MGLFTPTLMSLTARICLTLVCLTPLATPLTADDHTPTVYEVFEDYDLPAGLLPKGVVGYDLEKTTGKFSAYLNGTCSFSLKNSYQLKYESTIKGSISKHKLTNLKGISVKLLLLWVNIVEVVRNGDELEFSVGIGSAVFPVDNFAESPQCGCGLDCVNGGKLELAYFVGSDSLIFALLSWVSNAPNLFGSAVGQY